ncbi:c-type cytochrome [Thiolapillus sp.]
MAKKFHSSVLSLLAIAAMGSATLAAAEDDVMARIKPVGEVNVAAKTAGAPAVAATAAPATASAAPTAPAAAPAAPAAAAADPGAALFQSKGCGGCHGADARTTPMDTYPKLAGQSVEYLLAQMKDIKSGTRANGQTAMMKGIIAGVSEDEMKSIAEWLTKQ